MSSKTWDLEVRIDQFTWIPQPDEKAIIPEMRWQNLITVFPESIDLGELVVKPLKTRGPLKRNPLIAEKSIIAQDYLSATQILFQKTQHVLDLLSVVTSRGFRIQRIMPSESVLRRLGLVQRQSPMEKIRSYLLRKLAREPTIEASLKGDETTRILTAYKELVAVIKSEGFLEENAVFTTDFPGKGTLQVKIEMLRKDELNRRLTEARKNLPKILAAEELSSAIRLYRVSLQLNDYTVRYVLQWTALESATQIPKGVTGQKKIDRIGSEMINVPGIADLKSARDLLKKLNLTRNVIVHKPALAIKPDFQEDLTKQLVGLEWLLYNYLLFRLGFPMLPQVSSPLKP